jgi:hypothetical protein
VRANPSSNLIRAVAILTAAAGLFEMIRHWLSYRYAFSVFPDTFSIAGPSLAILGMAMLLLPPAKLVIAFGLLCIQRWAWFTALPILLLDFFLRALIAVRLHAATEPASDALAAALRSGATVERVESLWPSYMMALVSIISVIVLLSKSSRNKFLISKDPMQAT